MNDGTSLAMIEDGTVDLVFSFDSLVHVEADVMDAYLDEIARVPRRTVWRSFITQISGHMRQAATVPEKLTGAGSRCRGNRSTRRPGGLGSAASVRSCSPGPAARC